MKLYKIASLAGAIAMTGMSVASVAAAPPLTLQPISIGAETARFDRGVATVSLTSPAGAVEVRPLPLRDDRTLAFSVAVYNRSGRAANFGTANVTASFDRVPLRVLTHDDLADAATHKARDRQVGALALAGVLAGVASTASTTRYGYRVVHTPRATYARAISWQDNSIGAAGAVAAVGAGAMAARSIGERLDYTLDRIDGETLQTTTVDPDASLGGVVTVALYDDLRKRPGVVHMTVRWNGEHYPFAFRLAPPGAPAQEMPATQPGDGF